MPCSLITTMILEAEIFALPSRMLPTVKTNLRRPSPTKYIPTHRVHIVIQASTCPNICGQQTNFCSHGTRDAQFLFLVLAYFLRRVASPIISVYWPGGRKYYLLRGESVLRLISVS